MPTPGPRPNQIQSATPNFNTSSGYTYNPGPNIQRGEFNIPASTGFAKGAQRAFAPPGQGDGLLDRAAGVAEMGLWSLGLPQELASRGVSALTGGGGTEALPSDVLTRLTGGAFGQNPIDQFVTNFTLDPLMVNPFDLMRGVPKAISANLDNVRHAEQLLQRPRVMRDVLLDARGPHPLLFVDATQAADIAQKAGVYAPIRQDSLLRSFYFDFDGVKRPSLERQKLREELQRRSAYLYESNVNQRKLFKPEAPVGDPQHLSSQVWEQMDDEYKKMASQPWDFDPLKAKEQRSIFAKFFAGPSNYSPILKGQVQSYEKAREVAADHKKDFSEFVIEHTADFNFHRGQDSPAARAFLYLVKGDTALLKADTAAETAYKANQLKMQNSANAIRQRIFQEMNGIDHEKFTRKKLLTPGDVIANFDDKGAATAKAIPDELWKWMTGVTLDQQSANPVTHLLGMQRRLAKERFLKPVEKAIVKARKEGAMLPREAQYSEMLSGAFIGREPNAVDKELQKLIINNKETLRAWGWNQKLHKLLSAPTEELIASAEKGQSIVAKGTEFGRKVTYASLLGFALDSSIRNLVGGTLNTVAEYGLKSLEHVVPAFKAASDKRWAESLHLDNVLSHSNSMLEEWFHKTPFIKEGSFMEQAKNKPLQTLFQVAMSPMQFTENVNRSMAYFAALDHELKVGGKPMGQAIQAAQEAVKKLHFGYSNIDVSPFLNNPAARVFSQFMIYPVRQMELLHRWSQEPASLGRVGDKLVPQKFRNKLVKYLALTGGVLNYGTRHGLDMTNILGVGLGFSEYPSHLRYNGDGVAPHFTALPPVVQLANATFNGAKNFMDMLSVEATGSPTFNQEYNKQEAWDSFGDLFRLLVPGGRYSSKLAKNALEWSAENDVTKQWGPEVSSFLGARYDPTVNGTDRMLSILGFAPTSEQQKREQIQFFRTFSKYLQSSIGSLNDEVVRGKDYRPLQDKLRKQIVARYGNILERNGVNAETLQGLIKPSPMSSLTSARKRYTTPPAEQAISGLPRVVRDQVDLDLYR